MADSGYYRREWNAFDERAEALIELAGRGAPARVLDVGCGAAQELRAAPTGALAVGVDSEPVALDIATELHGSRPGPSPALLRATAETLPFADAAFDVVLCRLALLYCDVVRTLSEMVRVLASDGTLITKIHTARYYRRQLATGFRQLDGKSTAHAARVLAFGGLFALTGRQPSISRRGERVREVYLSVGSVKRRLAALGLRTLAVHDPNAPTPTIVARR